MYQTSPHLSSPWGMLPIRGGQIQKAHLSDDLIVGRRFLVIPPSPLYKGGLRPTFLKGDCEFTIILRQASPVKGEGFYAKPCESAGVSQNAPTNRLHGLGRPERNYRIGATADLGHFPGTSHHNFNISPWVKDTAPIQV